MTISKGNVVNVWHSTHSVTNQSINAILNLMKIDDDSITNLSLTREIATVLDEGVSTHVLDENYGYGQCQLKELIVHRIMFDDGTIAFANSNNMEKLLC